MGTDGLMVMITERILTDNQYQDELGNYSTVYGDGKTGERIARILSEIEISDRLMRKN